MQDTIFLTPENENKNKKRESNEENTEERGLKRGSISVIKIYGPPTETVICCDFLLFYLSYELEMSRVSSRVSSRNFTRGSIISEILNYKRVEKWQLTIRSK